MEEKKKVRETDRNTEKDKGGESKLHDLPDVRKKT